MRKGACAPTQLLRASGGERALPADLHHGEVLELEGLDLPLRLRQHPQQPRDHARATGALPRQGEGEQGNRDPDRSHG